MKSFWSVQYHGNDVGCFLRKLERRLGVALVDPKHQTSEACPDEAWIEFYVEHTDATWGESLLELLLVSQRLSRAVHLSGDASQLLIGTAVVPAEAPVPGLVGCAWRIQSNQNYHALEMIHREAA